jgi:beta-glucanase (GH16 family)
MLRKPLAAVVGIVLTSGLLVGSSATTATAASSRISVGASPAQPWPGEATRIAGRVTPKGGQVELQKRKGSRWVKVTRARSSKSRGAYAFSVRASTTRTAYRVMALKTRVKGKSYSAKASAARFVQARKPVVKLGFDKAPIGVGDQTPGHVRVSPARARTSVLVQRSTGRGWATAKSGTTGNGRFEFQLKPGTASYRVAVKAPGANVWTFSAAVKASSSKLVWSDEFSTSSIGSTWKHRDVGRRYGNRVCSTTAEKNSWVSGGVMRLKVTADASPQQDPTEKPVDFKSRCKSGTYLNAMVDAQSRQFTYGTFAAKVRFQAPRGMHGAFWLQSEGTPEIDVAEYFGLRSGDGLASYLHPRGGSESSRVGASGANNAILKQRSGAASTGFHVYSVEWTSAGYVFRIDGTETFRTTKLRSDDPHFPVLSILASDWEIPSLDKSQLSKASMDVDWVRVWK